MTAAMVQMHQELFIGLTRLLGLRCQRQHIAVFSRAGNCKVSFGYGSFCTTMSIPWSEIHNRQPDQMRFYIAVLNGVLQDGIYEEAAGQEDLWQGIADSFYPQEQEND